MNVILEKLPIPGGFLAAFLAIYGAPYFPGFLVSIEQAYFTTELCP